MLGRGDPAFGLLLKGVDDPDRLSQLKRIDHAIGVAFRPDRQLPNPAAEPGHGLGDIGGCALRGDRERVFRNRLGGKRESPNDRKAPFSQLIGRVLRMSNDGKFTTDRQVAPSYPAPFCLRRQISLTFVVDA